MQLLPKDVQVWGKFMQKWSGVRLLWLVSYIRGWLATACVTNIFWPCGCEAWNWRCLTSICKPRRSWKWLQRAIDWKRTGRGFSVLERNTTSETRRYVNLEALELWERWGGSAENILCAFDNAGSYPFIWRVHGGDEEAEWDSCFANWHVEGPGKAALVRLNLWRSKELTLCLPHPWPHPFVGCFLLCLIW